MQLQIFHTGNVVPTCGEDGVHTPTIWYFNGFPVRVIFRPNLPADRALAFVQTDVAAALGYKDPKHAARSMNLIESEDCSVESVSTERGERQTKVLTFKGLSKFLMRSDHKTAVEFQDWLAGKSSDLAFHGFAVADKSAKDEMARMDDSVSRQELNAVLVQMGQMLSQQQQAHLQQQQIFFQQMLDKVSPKRAGRSQKIHSLNRLTASDRARLKAANYDIATPFLITKENYQRQQAAKGGLWLPVNKLGQSVAAGFTSRCVACADQHHKRDGLYKHFVHHGKVVTLIFQPLMEAVFASDWRTGEPSPLLDTLGLYASGQ